jgi:hypothetical protein
VAEAFLCDDHQDQGYTSLVGGVGEALRPNKLRIHVARRGEQVMAPSRRPVVDEIWSVEAEAAT